MGGRRLPGEFDLIARYFRPLAAGQPGALDLADDAALLDVPPGRRLVVTADALVEGVHFLRSDPAELVARKMLRVNLSDLAAMGAAPLGYLMTVGFPDWVDESWVAGFAAGLAADQAEFGLALVGGDTTATPGPLVLSVTALGLVPDGRALLRRGARPGDRVMVSGTLGDAALGLRALQGMLPRLAEPHRAALVDRYRLPRPRLALGRAVLEAGAASAAIDLSDGLVADLGHVCAASGCGAEVEAAALPLSAAGAAALAIDPGLRSAVLAGGDDYELLLAVPEDRVAAACACADRLGLGLAAIGRFVAASGVRALDETGREIALDRPGFRHF